MSGGYWGYREYVLSDIENTIKNLIENNGKLKSDEELYEYNSWTNKDWYEKYPEEKYHTKYSEKVIKEFKKALKVIKKSNIYIGRLDYLLSGDDSEESFLERLNKELNEKN